MSFLSLDEMTCRDGTPYPAEWIEKRFKRLQSTFDAIRAEWGAPLRVLSGYRTPEYNVSIGGKARSQHVQGRAADIRPADGRSASELHEMILRLHVQGKLPELGGLGKYEKFVHIDVRPSDGRLARW